jgi:hypothetical protein
MIGSAGDYQAFYDSQGQLHVTDYSRAHVTFDGGQTWTNYVVPFNTNLYTFTGDPAVALDADGNAYLATLGFTLLPNGDTTPADIQVTHSVDGGRSWTVPVRVAAGSGTPGSTELTNDKDYIAAWGHGNAIVTWTEVFYDNSGNYEKGPIFASVTHDGGNTWTAPIQISPQKLGYVGDAAAVPVVAADGNIYVAFLSNGQGGKNSHDQYMVVKVDPATGKAVKDPVQVADLVDNPVNYPVNVNNRPTYQDSQFRTWAAGNIAADPTNARHLAVVWSDMRNSTLPAPTDPYQAKTNSDIVVSQSYDGGNTWSAPTTLAIPNDQFMPWGAYNASGQLQIGFFDRSYDPANHKYGFTLASETTPGSLNFTFQQVTTALSDPTQGDAFFATTVNSSFPKATTFMGDYSNIAISPSGVAAFWTDMRLLSTFPGFSGAGEDAFFALVPTPPPPATAASQPASAVAPTSGVGMTASFLGTNLFSAPFSSTLPAPNQNSDIRHAMAAGIWSLDTISVNRGLADFSEPYESLALARAVMRSAGLSDDAWQDAFGAGDFAMEELQ